LCASRLSKTAEERGESGDTVATLAELYLGNILYALERCALSLKEQGDEEGAAYYRGLAKALADARGKERAIGD
jgi:hypothetical protein